MPLLMKFLLPLILVMSTSCSYVEINDPKDKPSHEEQKMIDDVLDDLEERFSNIGVKENLREIPVFVVDEPSSSGALIAGLCRFKARIIIDRGLFREEMFEEGKISWLWWTILHEVGHCYFDRFHDDSEVFSDESMVFVFDSRLDVDEPSTYVCKIQASVMSTFVPAPNRMYPDNLKDFYVLEMANHNSFDLNAEESIVKDLPFHKTVDEAEKEGYVSRVFEGDCSPP